MNLIASQFFYDGLLAYIYREQRPTEPVEKRRIMVMNMIKLIMQWLRKGDLEAKKHYSKIICGSGSRLKTDTSVRILTAITLICTLPSS